LTAFEALKNAHLQLWRLAIDRERAGYRLLQESRLIEVAMKTGARVGTPS